MVGDRRQDVNAAHICKIPCVGVKFGYAEKDELENAGADKIASSVDELYTILSE